MGYRFVAFRAVENREESLRFQAGHTQVLIDVGIENISSNEPSWISDPDVYVLSVFDENDEIVGGLRVHHYLGKTSLPIIDALSYLDSSIEGVFQRSLPKGTAEICGLWNSKRVFGKGISPLLCKCSVVMVASIGLTDFYCFSAPYTEKMIRSMGCREVPELGDHGKFFYPNEKFISTVLYCPDVRTLEIASPENRERIFNLMDNPFQTYLEEGPRGNFEVNYSLFKVVSHN